MAYVSEKVGPQIVLASHLIFLAKSALCQLPENASWESSWENASRSAPRNRPAQGTEPLEMPRELFRRMAFNILIGNTDEHARNHAAFVEGGHLALTPAYDIEPRPRMAREANQALRVCGESRQSRVALAIEAAPSFGLTAREAEDLMIGQVEVRLPAAGGPGPLVQGRPAAARKPGNPERLCLRGSSGTDSRPRPAALMRPFRAPQVRMRQPPTKTTYSPSMF